MKMKTTQRDMRKVKRSHKILAIFLNVIMLSALLPYNMLYANNNGPNSPEAAGFEPVDATDMVSLSTGDLSYVLPLLHRMIRSHTTALVPMLRNHPRQQ